MHLLNQLGNIPIPILPMNQSETGLDFDDCLAYIPGEFVIVPFGTPACNPAAVFLAERLPAGCSRITGVVGNYDKLTRYMTFW